MIFLTNRGTPQYYSLFNQIKSVAHIYKYYHICMWYTMHIEGHRLNIICSKLHVRALEGIIHFVDGHQDVTGLYPLPAAHATFRGEHHSVEGHLAILAGGIAGVLVLLTILCSKGDVMITSPQTCGCQPAQANVNPALRGILEDVVGSHHRHAENRSNRRVIAAANLRGTAVASSFKFKFLRWHQIEALNH